MTNPVCRSAVTLLPRPRLMSARVWVYAGLAAAGVLGVVATPSARATGDERARSTTAARTDALTTPAEADVLTGYALEFKNHDVTLAQPFFEGRAPGTRGNQLAAEYVEFNFKKAGLKPAFPAAEKELGSGRTYRQPLQMGTTLKVAKESAAYEAHGQQVALTPGADFNTLGSSGTAEAAGPLVFCGYSIVKGEKNKDGKYYTSYPGESEAGGKTDLKGKIAVVLRFEPMDENGQSLWAGSAWSLAAAREPKILAAADRGAAGVILVNAPGAADERINKLETTETTRPTGKPCQIPVVMMSIDAADKLVRAADAQGRSLLDLRKLVDEAGQVIDLPNATATLRTDLDRQPIMTDNVGGVLAGSGALADQYVVLGAHYDHVGYGYFGSRENAQGKLHPGADDNASGTSAMLVLADRLTKAYAELPADQPRRSILFLGFTAEESGLNGSRHYIQNPSVAKEQIYIMLNLDMVGRMKDEEVEISGVGTGEGLADFVRPYFDSSGLKIASKPGGGGPSDHASFNSAKIPVLFFFTMLHKEYHTPADVAALINNEGAARIIDLADRMILDLARRPEPMPYSSGTATAPATSEHASADPGQNPGPTGSRVRFGIMPGYSETDKGVLADDVFPMTSAAEAGLKVGDRMIKWNGVELESVKAWNDILATHNPGDKVEIVYIRDGKEQTTTAVLKGRKTTGQ